MAIPTNHPATRTAASMNRSLTWPMRLALLAGVATTYFTLFYERKEVPGVVDHAAAEQSKTEHMKSGAIKSALGKELTQQLKEERRAQDQ